MKNSIRKRLMSIQFIVTFILVLVVMIATYSIYYSRTRESVKSVSDMCLNTVEKNLDWTLQSLEAYSKMAISNQAFQDEMIKYKLSSQLDELKQFQDSIAISNILMPFIVPRTPIEGVSIYECSSRRILSTNNDSIFSNPEKRQEIEKQLTLDNLVIWGIPREATSLSRQRMLMLPYYMKIYDARSGFQLGLIECQVPLSEFSSNLESLGMTNQTTLLIMNTEGKVLAANKAQDAIKESKEHIGFGIGIVGQGLKKKDGYLIETRLYEKTGWIIASVFSIELMTIPLRHFSIWYSAIGAVLMMILWLAASKVSNKITAPILAMSKALLKSQGRHSEHMPVTTDDEIGQLAESYNQMVDKLDAYVLLNEKKQLQLRQYELSLLQAQINPHFLNNTLENICGLIELDRKQDSIALIRDTAQFYRSILSGGETIVPLERELKIVELFLKIENVRLSNRIHYSCDVGEAIQSARIVKLTLQPLVENAIHHGFAASKDPWKLALTGKREGDDVVLKLADNGIVMSAEIAKAITERDPSLGKRKKVGVYATHRRLQLSFGQAYGLSYISEEKQGTEVFIRIPFGEKRNG